MGYTYKYNASNASLHLFQGDAVLNANHLLLHGDGVLQALKHDVGEVAHKGKAVIGSVGHKGVEDFVSSSTELVVCILSAIKLAPGLDS